MGVYRFVCGGPFVEGEQTGKTSVCVFVCLWGFSNTGIYCLSKTTAIRKHCHLLV